MTRQRRPCRSTPLDDGVLPRGDEVTPVGGLGRRGACRDHTAVRRAFRGLHDQCVVDDGAERLTVGADRDHPPFDLAGAKKPRKVHEPQVVGLRVDPIAEQKPAAVARKRSERSPCRRESLVLGIRELPEQHDVAGNVLTHAVEHDLTAVSILRVLQVLVHESAAVRKPVRRLGLARDLKGQHLARVHVEQVQRRVFVACAVGPVRHRAAVR